jgi:hypothetical protein
MNLDPSQIQLNADQQAELADVSAQAGKPWPVVFREALSSYRADQVVKPNGQQGGESLFDALSQRGLLGCLQGGPKDLSTNPAYLEGFGESNV